MHISREPRHLLENEKGTALVSAGRPAIVLDNSSSPSAENMGNGVAQMSVLLDYLKYL